MTRLVNDDWRLLGVRRLVNDGKEENWRDFSHARAKRSSADLKMMRNAI